MEIKLLEKPCDDIKCMVTVDDELVESLEKHRIFLATKRKDLETRQTTKKSKK